MYIDLALWLCVINTSGRFCTPLGHISEFDVIDVSGVMNKRGGSGVCGGGCCFSEFRTRGKKEKESSEERNVRSGKQKSLIN